jgi:hypothetical protein
MLLPTNTPTYAMEPAVEQSINEVFVSDLVARWWTTGLGMDEDEMILQLCSFH